MINYYKILKIFLEPFLMKNITNSFLFALSILILSNNIMAIDSTILNTIKEISVDNVTDLEKVELMYKIEYLNSILEISTENDSKEETALLKTKINLLNQLMSEKYPTIWKKVKTFVENHKLAISAAAVVLIVAIIVTVIVKAKKKNLEKLPLFGPKTADGEFTNLEDYPVFGPAKQKASARVKAAVIKLIDLPILGPQNNPISIIERLNKRIQNTLKTNNIINDQQLQTLSDEDILQIKGFGTTSLEEIHKIFAEDIEKERVFGERRKQEEKAEIERQREINRKALEAREKRERINHEANLERLRDRVMEVEAKMKQQQERTLYEFISNGCQPSQPRYGFQSNYIYLDWERKRYKSALRKFHKKYGEPFVSRF